MERVDTFVKKINSRISFRFRTAFISAAAAGLIAHLYMFTNKLPNYDDLIGLDNFGVTFKIGRWFLWILGACAYHLDLVFSLPWINGIITIMLLGLSAGLTADLLNIESKTGNVLLGAALVVFPSWTGTFFFMFTAPYYAAAVLLVVMSVYSAVNYKKGIFISVILLACSLGIYQSYLPFTATLYVIILILMLFDDNSSYMDVLKKSLLYLFDLAAGVVLYFLFMKISLIATGQELREYKGISTMGKFKASRIPDIISTVSANFFGIFLNNNLELSYNYITKAMYFVLFIVCAMAAVHLVMINIKRNSVLKAVEAVVLFAAYVIAVNSIYIMCENGIYSLMYYSYVFLMVFPLALLDRCMKSGERNYWIITEYVTVFVLFLGTASYCHFDNGQYLSMQLSFEQASSFYTSMIANIKGTEGYRDDMKVVISGNDIVDKTFYRNEVMSTFSMSGRDDALADAYSKQNFILYYCGFDAEIADENILSGESLEKLEKMPEYPNSGSIRIMEDVVVVKLSQ